VKPEVDPVTVASVVGVPNEALGAIVVTGASVVTVGVCGISGLQPSMLNLKAADAPCQATG